MAQTIEFEPSKIVSEKTFREKMQQNNMSDKTLLNTDDELTNQILNGRKHVFSIDENKIVLDNGKVFKKSFNPVYPAEFTNWISGVDLYPEGKPELKRPHGGVPKKWKGLPQLVEEVRLTNNLLFRHITLNFFF
jgi:hypothetical protein